jgi:hypothetical protein
MSVLVLAELLNNILPVLYFEPNICSLLDQPSHQSCKHTYLFKTLICCMMAKANPLQKAMLDADKAINITTEPATEDADITVTTESSTTKLTTSSPFVSCER